MKADTLTNHPPVVTVAPDNPPLVAPVYQSVKFTLDSFGEAERMQHGEREAFFYSRVDNPTLKQLELTLAMLQQRDQCVLACSGVAAVALTLQALCQQGDHIVICAEGYLPTRAVARRVLARFGVSHSIISIDDLTGLAQLLASRPTRLIVFESPTNPMLKVADLAQLCAIAKAHDCLTVLDNTLAGVHAHGQYPVDVFVHSLTKYANGHGDVLGGAVLTNEPIATRLRHEFMTMGSMLDPHAAFLIQRGLKTYMLRFERACQNAQSLAQWLAEQPAVASVVYPGLTSHPQHALALRQTGNGGAVITFAVRGGQAEANRLVSALRLFRLAASLGSTESLVMPPSMLQARDLDASQREWAGIGLNTVRLSVGIEHIDDLRADLEQALQAV